MHCLSFQIFRDASRNPPQRIILRVEDRLRVRDPFQKEACFLIFMGGRVGQPLENPIFSEA